MGDFIIYGTLVDASQPKKTPQYKVVIMVDKEHVPDDLKVRCELCANPIPVVISTMEFGERLLNIAKQIPNEE